MGAPAPAVDQTAIVRKRRFSVRSLDDVARVLEQMKRERFEGVIKMDFRCGGVVTSIEVEERQGIDLTSPKKTV